MADEVRHGDTVVIDRLALSRAQHLKSHKSRRKSVSEDEFDAASDWSESDRECCPLSDFECGSNIDEFNDTNQYDTTLDDDDDRLQTTRKLTEHSKPFSEMVSPLVNSQGTSTYISFSSDSPKSKQQEKLTEKTSPIIKTTNPQMYFQKQSQQPLLPARRLQSKQTSSGRPTPNIHVLPSSTNFIRNQKTITPNPARHSTRRETTLNSSFTIQPTKESTLSPNSSFHSNDDNQIHQRCLASPNLSQISATNSLAPRIYELKKIYIDDCDFGRVTDVSTKKPIPVRDRQKWGTIIHPPFPLGYQYVAPEQVTHIVERLASPVRCRDRHTPIQTPSKRYLSVEETDALISRLSKAKPVRTGDQYWSVQNRSRPFKNLDNALKPNTNYKGVGISA